MLFPNVFIGKIWRKSQKGVYLQRQKNLKKVCSMAVQKSQKGV